MFPQLTRFVAFGLLALRLMVAVHTFHQWRMVSLAMFLLSVFIHRLWIYALALFLAGWTLQFIGHAFEHKEPEFFHDWRFLFVGVRWWWAKIHGKA